VARQRQRAGRGEGDGRARARGGRVRRLGCRSALVERLKRRWQTGRAGKVGWRAALKLDGGLAGTGGHWRAGAGGKRVVWVGVEERCSVRCEARCGSR
jgi:hypothetical protein